VDTQVLVGRLPGRQWAVQHISAATLVGRRRRPVSGCNDP
jgi:hypothetical protein